jgi:biopolymer transport protein ExbB/TolQ
MAALGAKFLFSRAEQAACTANVVPPWDGRTVPVSEAITLLAGVKALPGRLLHTYLGRRVHAVLEFLCQRRSAAELDDQLRALADNDCMALEGSYALTRFITWAIPILGFLGTVLGITEAIANVSPEMLEKNLSSVTNGLALAFDATALGLALTMVTMFCSFLVERREQAVLEAVDQYVEAQLAHRFVRAGADAAPVIDAVRQNSQVLLDASEQLVRRQAEVWAQSLAEVQRRAADTQAAVQERLAGAVEEALERTQEAHARRLTALEQKAADQGARVTEQVAALAAAVRDTGREQQAALLRVAEGVSAQAAALARLQEGERALVQLQAALQQNLQALAASGQFDQAVHSLTAAVHLLTARVGAVEAAARPLPPLGKGPPVGKAA